MSEKPSQVTHIRHPATFGQAISQPLIVSVGLWNKELWIQKRSARAIGPVAHS